ncbi:Zinc finger RING/FYVE/PHD-type protein [Dioscorea alata]|uniref:Zinc finger RING/FYVE/PHD-type protein n=1 Tax=Dioscorea alata TaxID=55571 RepID=A0ACB7UV63_DIOAL|nr:Zinc finger RING/FYVE/PHD-type protein [Dioscorea alata]
MTSLEELLAGDGFKKGRLRQALLRFKLGQSKPDFFSRRSRSNVSDAARKPVDPAGFRRKSSIQRDAGEIKQEFGDRKGDEDNVGGFPDEIEEEEMVEVERFRARKAEKNQGKLRFRDDNPRSDTNEDARRSRASEPPLDEAAIGALVSILMGSLRRFFKDENFRASLRHTCLSWLYPSGGNGRNGDSDSRVIANLREAIGIVEGAVKTMPDPRDLKRASLKLSVLAGLSYGDLKKGFTGGIPNLHLSACAHLYLSLFYRLQKKNKASGRHLLQVFCDVPYPGRTVLLLSLWERLIFPHLSHLKAWYEKEAELIPRTPSRLQKLQALEEVYNNALDGGTHRFAIYYKEWLIEENEARAPPFPCVDVPDNPFARCPREPSNMVGFKGASSSKRLDLYLEEEEEEEEVAEEQFNVLLRSSDQGNDGEDEGAWSSSPESNENIKEDQRKSHHQANVPSDLTSMITKTKPDRNGMIPTNSEMASSLLQSSAEPSGIFEDMGQGSVFSGIPNDFVCPLTGHLFKDPVTLETGQTFEKAAIKEWFKQGKKTCPVTGRGLKSLSIPVTDFVLKCVMDEWRLEHCRNLLIYATQISGSVVKGYKSKDELACLIIEKIVSGLNTDEQMENARRFISLGGLHFLTWRLEMGNLEEKMHVVTLMLCCIKADDSCRSFLAINIEGPWILDLLYSKILDARANAVLLMIELICLNSRLGIASFLRSLTTETIVSTMHVLLLYLQTSPPEERALVAVLLLHLDLMVEPLKYSIYKEEAIDGIIVALEHSLYDGEVIKNASKALLMLGGRFSSSGKTVVETWLLKQAGFIAHSSITSIAYAGEAEPIAYDGEAEENITKEEEKDREEWSNKLALVLLCNGKQPFLGTLVRCLSSKVSEIVKACLITVAWLSNSLPSLYTAGFQLSNFTTLIPILKEIMIKDNRIENQVLASLSLLNLSTIYECRDLLKTFAKELFVPLQNLGEVTWTAKQLHTAIYSDY